MRINAVKNKYKTTTFIAFLCMVMIFLGGHHALATDGIDLELDDGHVVYVPPTPAPAVDKQPLLDVIGLHDMMEEYIKNNKDIQNALKIVMDVNNKSNPTNQEVKDSAKALEEAMQKAIDEETARQLKAEEALELAEKTIEDNKAKKYELPVVDKAAIQALIDVTLDAEYKKELQARLDTINEAVEQKRNQIAADKKAESERKPTEELAEKRAEEIKKQQSLKQPNTGVVKEENNVGIFAAIAVVAISIFVSIVLFAKKKLSKQ